SDAGDRQAALDSITEAVTHYRALAEANPAAFLPNLAGSLNNLSNQQSNAGDRHSSHLITNQLLASFPPGPRAELLVSRAHWLFTQDEHAEAITNLVSAARYADEAADPMWAGRARRSVRDLVETMRQSSIPRALMDQATAKLPDWAVVKLLDECIERFNRWLSAQDWSEREDFLRQTHAVLTTPEGLAILDIVRALYPEAMGLNNLAELLQEAEARGLPQVLDERRAWHTASDLLTKWLATPTWPEDLEFLRSNSALLNDPLVRNLLIANSDDPSSRQHLGILELADRLAIPDIYDAITDPTTAVDTAMAFIKQGHPEGIIPLLLAVPVLSRLPFVAPYLIAVHQLFAPADEDQNATHDTNELIKQAVTEGSEIQRGAGAKRLQELARHRPGHAGVLHALADALTAPSQDNPEETATSDAG
ncbi:hypothetical protein ACFQLX_23225, partial [Streptomyces polyrhachis]